MKLEGVELRRIRMPLRTPFRTSFGTEHERDVLLLRAVTTEAEGWGECVAMSEPLYSSEHVDGAAEVISRFLVPAVSGATSVAQASVAMARFKGHPMAKAAVEMALLDAQLRASGMSFGTFLGAVRPTVPAGVSVGIASDIPSLLSTVEGFLAEGYVRIKLKIEPGWDVEPVRAVRGAFGDSVPLQVDANAAYSLSDARHLARLDDFDLLLIEEPLDSLHDHVSLARQLRTPICLDESITSARVAAEAISAGACQVVNIKAGRVGGYLEARRVHDVCSAHGVPVWCGGMLETGIGRAANVALAALPGFVLPGDVSASDRYFAEDVAGPFVVEEGSVRVPEGAGLGVVPDAGLLASLTTSVVFVS
ncbi:o-succinylbenzoate synthase [Allokutzneria sp. NRRL B-24872]|uniref:o-succinylbenzoate synthase n=1 Tax=Allokutzneria sp. NRRL B-24872 TaxID=1137961 RepID=UPI000A38892E|nr:o-succinylbenzoate synthase [Allokutzneria sp. NRRL B-24872]